VTKEAADRFVGQMRRDHAFRTAVRLATDEIELNGILKNHGFEFTMNELAKAMASCMDELDSMEVTPSEE